MGAAGTGRGQERRRANIPYGGQDAEETGDREGRTEGSRAGALTDGTNGNRADALTDGTKGNRADALTDGTKGNRAEGAETGYLLDLFITHWTEAWEIGKKAFQMIGLQRGVDWKQVRVWIVHDGVRKFPEKYFLDMPCKVRQVEIPHGGIAAARNWGIDHGDGEWIKWCDFDDMLHNIYSLRRLCDAMERGQGYDMLWFDYTAEHKDGRRVWLRRDRDPVLIHGKAFRRSWLREHGIRYNEELTWCEDSAFLAVCEMEADIRRIGHVKCEAPIYAWITRDGSLCNRPEIKYDNMRSFFRRHRYVQEEFRKRGCMGPYYVMTIRIMGDCYKHLFLEDCDADMTEYLEEILQYWKEHRGDFFKVDAERYEMAMKAVETEGQYEKDGKVWQRRIDREAFRAWLRSLTGEIRKRDAGKEAAGKEAARDAGTEAAGKEVTRDAGTEGAGKEIARGAGEAGTEMTGEKAGAKDAVPVWRVTEGTRTECN